MPNDPERYLTLRQADQARTDFAIIEDELEVIYARVAACLQQLSQVIRSDYGCADPAVPPRDSAEAWPSSFK
jgi:hypothetical protein